MNQLKRVIWISLKNHSLNESIGPNCYAEFPIMVLGSGGGVALNNATNQIAAARNAASL